MNHHWNYFPHLTGSDISDNVEGVTAKKLSLSLVYVADGDDHAKPLKCVLHSDAWKKNKAWETGEGADVKTPTCRVGILNISFGPKLNCSDKQVCVCVYVCVFVCVFVCVCVVRVCEHEIVRWS